ncbi:MAG: hypothetical protein B6U89_05305 [Desulfurococcales archaeon ex4484_58]|nr:MAG: hypothetical protein B6U89_05305 [Desulfurococcales archaeon ex4484_58]
MRIMVLLTDKRSINTIIDKISRKDKDEQYIIVTDYDVVREVGRSVYRQFNKNVEIYIFKNNYPEENALKIMIHNYPDKVLDCDPLNKLYYLKELMKNTLIDMVPCSDPV